MRVNEKFVHYAGQTQLLPPGSHILGLAFAQDQELFEKELARINEARRKAREAEERAEAAKAQAEEETSDA